VLEEFLKTVLEEYIGATFSGAFRSARSGKARVLKSMAWISFLGSLVSFLAAWQLVNRADVESAMISGVACAFSFSVFSFSAAVVNAKTEITAKVEITVDNADSAQSDFMRSSARTSEDAER
jgi:hypothetical protein